MFSKKINPILNDLIDKVIVQPVPSMVRVAEMFAIKYLYVILALLVLKDSWYVGSGSYEIDFVFWKELLASAVFLGITLVHLKFEPKAYFPKSLLHILYVLYYIPVNCSFALNNQSTGFFFLSNLYFLLLILSVYFFSGFFSGKLDKLRPRSTPEKQSLINDKGLNWFCAIICCVFVLYKLCYNGLSFSVSIDSTNVYENRSEYQSFLDAISGTSLAYVISLLKNLIAYVAPFYMLVCLLRRNFIGAGLSLLTILSSYSMSSGKSTLFFIAIVAGVYLLRRWKLCRHFNRIFDLGILLLSVLCLGEHLFLHSDRFYTVILRRLMYLPAWINTMYYDYFMEHGMVWWSQNTFLLQNLIPDVYDVSPLTIISNVYFQGEVPSPNTGLMAEAIMHAGILGVFLYPPILGLMVALSGKVLKQYGPAVQLLIAAKLALNLTNVPITRTDFVLSYFAFIVLLLVIPFLTPLGKWFLSFSKQVRRDLEQEE